MLEVRDDDREPRRRADAGGDRIPPVLSVDRFAARRVDASRVGARTRWLLAANKLPTGETEPIERLVPDPQAARASRTTTSTTCSAISCVMRHGRATMTVTREVAARWTSMHGTRITVRR